MEIVHQRCTRHRINAPFGPSILEQDSTHLHFTHANISALCMFLTRQAPKRGGHHSSILSKGHYQRLFLAFTQLVLLSVLMIPKVCHRVRCRSLSSLLTEVPRLPPASVSNPLLRRKILLQHASVPSTVEWTDSGSRLKPLKSTGVLRFISFPTLPHAFLFSTLKQI